MRVSSVDEFLEAAELGEPEDHQAVHAQFPYVVLVECDVPELDVAMRWCWTCFGPLDGKCWSGSEYPACPIVMATEHSAERMGADGKIYKIKKYDRVADHSHTGEWTVIWLGKTDYNHGFAEFCFRVDAHKNRFLQRVPKIDWGENFPWVSGEKI